MSDHRRRTKIVATLGPASIPIIREMILAGVNVFRLNFSHLEDPNSQTPIINEIRKQSEELMIPVGILGDLCGPKIRCNAFGDHEYIELKAGQEISLVAAPKSNRKYPGNPQMIITPIEQIINQSLKGHRILLDDGYITLTVKDKKIFELDGELVNGLVCIIANDGRLKPKKGINCPDLKLNLSALTDKDKIDAKYIYEQNLEFAALSFVQRPDDVNDLISLFSTLSSTRKNPNDEVGRPLVIAKIEKPQAADGVMVARGDLGVETSLEKVPILQKELISKCNAAEKVVITATQMLESMISNPSPTRAEVSDVANAVFDGTDAVMLSAEAAVGSYPLEAVKMMSKICKQAEGASQYLSKPTAELIKEMKQCRKKTFSMFVHSIANSAVFAATEAEAKAIIAFTHTSDLPIIVSKCRSPLPILGLTDNVNSYRKLSLYYGIYPIKSSALRTRKEHGGIPSHLSLEAVLAQAEKDVIAQWETQLESAGNTALTSTAGPFVDKGDFVVFCAGFHVDFHGLSQTVKLATFGDAIVSDHIRAKWREIVKSVNPK